MYFKYLDKIYLFSKVFYNFNYTIFLNIFFENLWIRNCFKW